jgi:gluconate 2-dehydrogenase gamma chain
MRSPLSVSRREFLVGSALGAVWMAAAVACRERVGALGDGAATAHGPPPESGAPPRTLQVLTPEQFAELEAIAARIIPSDDTPGAREAGVVWFMDFALTSFAAEQASVFTDGLAQLQREVAAAHAGSTSFASLTEAQQDALLTRMQEGEFFGTVRFATIAGMFSLPKYGGNANYVGWELIGQEHVFEFTPPFGWYDHPDNQRALLGRVL